MSISCSRLLDAELHVVDQIGPAGQERRPAWPREILNRLAFVGDGDVSERVHVTPVSTALSIRHDSPHRRDDVGIRPAPADVARHPFADVIIGLGVAFVDQPDRRADLARRAVAALERIVLDERGLHRVQVFAVAKPFDRRDRLRLAPRRPAMRQELTRRPSTSTVHAPHWPWSHPFLVPVRSAISRRASSSVTRGSSCSVCSCR